MKQRVYVAGPMTGLPNFGFSIFDAAKERLERAGFIAITPADIDRRFGFDGSKPCDEPFRRMVMIEDLRALETCDVVVLLPGWERSRGVAVERAFAIYFDMPVFESVDAFLGGEYVQTSVQRCCR